MVGSSQRLAQRIHQPPHQTNTAAVGPTRAGQAGHRTAAAAQSDSDKRHPGRSPRQSRHRLGIVPRSASRDDQLDGPTYTPTRVGPPRTNIPQSHTPGPAGGLAPLRPAATAQSKAIAPTTARNSKPLWYPIHSTASEGSPPDQPRLGFRHSRRTLRNLQAGLRRISRRQPGDPTSAYTHLTVWAGRRDSESPPTSAP